jgi:septum formation inhibitor-activating ATPase MinD
MRVIERSKQRGSPIELIINDQYGARERHLMNAATRDGGCLKGILIPIVVEFRKIVSDLPAGIEHCTTLQIHIAEENIAIATDNLFRIEQTGP